MTRATLALRVSILFLSFAALGFVAVTMMRGAG